MEHKIEISVYNMLCMACLCVGRSLHHITDDKLKQYYLDIVKEIPLYNKVVQLPCLCWECEAILQKVVSFREQVKDAYRILETYSTDNLQEYLLSDIARQPRLKVHKNQSIVIPFETSSETFESQIVLEPETVKHVQAVYVKDEAIDSESDNENDINNEVFNCDFDFTTDHCNDEIKTNAVKQNAIENGNTVKNNKKKKVKNNVIGSKERREKKLSKSLLKQKKAPQKKTKKGERKILTIELTYEEIMAERADEVLSESYVKADYKCDSCLIGFNNERNYKEHIKSKHAADLGEYNCPICNTIISTVDSYTTHYKKHLTRYECGICGKRTSDRRAMQKHYDVTHEICVKEFKCKLCGHISKSKDAHRYHNDSHKSRVECPECDKTFSHRAGLLNHTQAVHKLNNSFQCSVCGQVFRWKTSLKKHMTKHDTKEKPAPAAYCAPCEVSFMSICSYQRHLRNSLKHVTTNQLRFICDHCNRRYANKTKLRDHIEEKHLNKTFHCHICLKPSKNRVCLEQHLRNVHKGRPMKCICHHCGKGFPTKVQLESHIRSHTGERPFICQFCPTTFSQQSNLYKHNRQVHLNIKSKRPAPRKPKETGSVLEAIEINDHDKIIQLYKL